jgi:hypothetical protein
MSYAHPRPWHAGSTFGAGPRQPLNRDQRARFKFLLNAHRRSRRISAKHELVGEALLKRLSVDGRCDPSHDCLADDAGCNARTVRRALDRLKTLGLVVWTCRIVRAGWRVVQTSNAYALCPTANPPPLVATAPKSTGGHFVRQTGRIDISTVPPASEAEVAAAQRALANRRAAVQTMLMKGKTSIQ